MTGLRVIVVALALVCASTAQAKTHAGVVKGAVRGAQGPFDALGRYQFTFRLKQQNGFALAEYRFLYRHKPNPRFLGSRFGARNIRFAEVGAVVPQWVVVEARVRFFDAAGKQDGSGRIYLFADELKSAGTWSDARGPKRVVPWARLFHKVTTKRALRDALPSDADYTAKLNKELLSSSSRIVIDRPRLLHLHYGPRVWQAFAAAHWRGHSQRLRKLSGKKFWSSDPISTAPSSEPPTRAHKDAAAIYRIGIPVRGSRALNAHNALTIQSPRDGSSVRTTSVAVSGRVDRLWRRLAKRVVIRLHGQTTYAVVAPDGNFTATITLRTGYNRITVELEGPAHKIRKTVGVNMYQRPRRTLYWVCMQSLAEKHKAYSRRWTRTFLSYVFVTHQTQTNERYRIQQQWRQLIMSTYGGPAWRSYSVSCTPYTSARYANRRFQGYRRYVRPGLREQQRYRRYPGVIVRFKYREH